MQNVMNKPANCWRYVRAALNVALLLILFAYQVFLVRAYDELQDYGNLSGFEICFKSLMFCFAFYCFGPFASMIVSYLGFFLTSIIGLTWAAAILVTLYFAIPFGWNVDYAFPTGIGLSTANILIYTVIAQSFEKYRPLMNNLFHTLIPALSFQTLFFVQRLPDDWLAISFLRTIILAVLSVVFVCLIVIVPILHFFPVRLTDSDHASNRKTFYPELITESVFLAFILFCGLDYEVSCLVYRGLGTLTESVGMSEADMRLMIILGGVVTFVSSLTSGIWCSGDTLIGSPINRFKLLFVFNAIRVLACAVLAFAADLHCWVLFGAYMFYSITVGYIGALPITLLSEHFGISKFPSCLGLMSLALGTFGILNHTVFFPLAESILIGVDVLYFLALFFSILCMVLLHLLGKWKFFAPASNVTVN